MSTSRMRRMRLHASLPVPAVLYLCLLSSVSSAQDLYISGLQPDRRPEGAPVIRTVVKEGAWYGIALHGIDPPYPHSFRFLEDQGNWYTPFNRPGMTGLYDLRGWHRRAGPQGAARGQ